MDPRPLTVLHASDLQCGKPYLPRAADALVRLAHELAPDVIVLAGDLTQRAKVREFRMATNLMERFPDVPLVTTPGNHDVPLYRLWERAFSPFRNWRRFVSPELDRVVDVAGARFVSLCTAAPHDAIVGGRLEDRQMDFARDAFTEVPDKTLRLLVMHHHLVPVPGAEGGHPLPRAVEWLTRIEAMGVDVVMSGHVHRLHMRTSRDLLDDGVGPGVPLVGSGTTTSRRGREPEVGWNSLTVVRVDDKRVEVTPYRLPPETTAFEPDEPITFPRPRAVPARTEPVWREAD